VRTYFIKRTGLFIVGLLIFNSCDNFLSENPDNRVELNNVEKAAQLLTNAYSNGSYAFTEWMGDNVSLTTGTFLLPEHRQLYHWEDVTSINQDTPPYFWNSTYDAIAHSNEVLAVIDNLPGDDALRNAVKSEAYLTRAYGHFMLVNLFALQYSEAEKDEDGIPYVSEPETEFIKTYSRESIEDVYDKIEEDILAGLELVNDSFYANSGKYHFTRNAALALASRFYLFKGDYDLCIQYSSQMLGADPSIFVKDIEGYLLSYSEPLEFLRLFTSPSDPSNLLLVRQITNTHVNVGYWPSPTLGQSIFQENPWLTDDIRISNRYPIFVRGNQFWAFGKTEFLFERSSLTSNVGLNYTIFPVFRGEEVLLNRAEAHAYQNNISAAIADLQIFINKRYVDDPVLTIALLQNHYGISNQRNALLEYILRERRKEFIHEGLRWFDIKRYEIRVRHDLEEGGTETLQTNDDRKVLQIPQAAIDVGGLTPNPR
jgi:starch-binding outer membrane protein, SusD/RagB family